MLARGREVSGEVVYLNGSFVPAQEAFVPALSEGVASGVGLFETMRARSGRVFRLGAHVKRLLNSAEALGIACPVEESHVAEIVAELARANGLDDARVRLTLLAREQEQDSDMFCRAKPLRREEVEPPPVRCAILQPGTAPPASVARHKTTNRLPYILAKRAAQELGADEGLLVNARGEVTEATSRNLFIVRGGVLLTPPIECGLLPGITRSVVLEIAHREGIPCQERPLPSGSLQRAEECFITSAIVGILPVRCIPYDWSGATGRKRPAWHDFCAHLPGSVTSRVMAAYRDLVAREIGP